MIVVQGRYDVVCPVRPPYLFRTYPIPCHVHRNSWHDKATTAWALKMIREGNGPEYGPFAIYLVPDAGHSSREPGIEKKLVEAADEVVEKY